MQTGAPPTARILASNQAVGPLFRELAEALCEAGMDVLLLAGSVDAPSDHSPPYRRLQGCPLEKTPARRRIATWARYTWQAFRAMACHRRRLAFLVTNPPLVPWVAPLAKALLGVRYGLLIYDIYPDVLVRAGMIRRNGLIDRALRRLSAAALTRAKFVITLGDRMAETLRRHLGGRDDVPIHVIPNWANTRAIRPLDKADNPFAAEHGLLGKFVVMYSGAFSDSHDLRSIVEAAELLREEPDVEFILIGEGPQKQNVIDWLAGKDLPNCRLLPWQPLDAIRHSLAAADVQIVSMGAGSEGTIVPSKTYPALAAGAALGVISPPGTEIAVLPAEEKCGFAVRPGAPEALAEEIQRLRRDPARLSRCKANARRAAVETYDVYPCTRRYIEIIRDALKA